MERPLKLCFMRHGPAQDREYPACPPDPARELTEEGAAKTQAAALGLKALGLKPDIVFSSPYLRALQTARIVCKVLGFPAAKIRQTQSLLPLAAPEEFLKELASLKEGTVFGFGHAPHCDALIAACLGNDSDMTSLKKAGAACLQIRSFSPVQSEIEWVLTPKALRLLGRSK